MLVILSSLLISYNYFTAHRHMLVHEQQDYIVQAMIDYRDTISAMTSIMRTIESDYLSLTAKDSPQEDFVSLFMDNMLMYPYIDKLRILDINGMEILRLNHDDGTPYVVPRNICRINQTVTFTMRQKFWEGINICFPRWI